MNKKLNNNKKRALERTKIRTSTQPTSLQQEQHKHLSFRQLLFFCFRLVTRPLFLTFIALHRRTASSLPLLVAPLSAALAAGLAHEKTPLAAPGLVPSMYRVVVASPLLL